MKFVLEKARATENVASSQEIVHANHFSQSRRFERIHRWTARELIQRFLSAVKRIAIMFLVDRLFVPGRHESCPLRQRPSGCQQFYIRRRRIFQQIENSQTISSGKLYILRPLNNGLGGHQRVTKDKICQVSM